MEKEKSFSLGGLPLVSIVLGMLQAYILGVNIWVGAGIGILISVMSVCGLIPILGIFLYKYIAFQLFGALGATLTWVYYLGLISAVIYTVIGFFFVILIFGDR